MAAPEDRMRDLRDGFDQAAEDYQRTRPVCPPQLFDDLIPLAGLKAGDRVVEIGCGTGQATVPLAERGLAITAVELGPELAAIARRRLTGFPAAQVVTGSFEDWPAPREARFDAVVAVSCLHWIDPRLRYAKPHGLLRSGGAMVVAGCQWARPADAGRFWTDVQADYRAVGFEGDPPPPPGQIGPWHFRALVEDRPGVLAEVTRLLAKHEISIASVIQHEAPDELPGEKVQLVIMTHTAPTGGFRDAVAEIDQLSCVSGPCVYFPVGD